MFFKGSRYEGVDELEATTAEGRVVRYKRLRIVQDPPLERAYRTTQEERPDLLAWKAYRDPERYWRICDANRVSWPDDLVAEPGKILRIPPSEG